MHALATDGALTKEAEFLRVPYFDARLVEEIFRRRLPPPRLAPSSDRGSRATRGNRVGSGAPFAVGYRRFRRMMSKTGE